MTHAALTESLELAADALGDPAPQVYARLYKHHPEMEAMFINDTDGGARSHMLYESFECLLDLAGEGRYAKLMIQAEKNTHEGIGIDPAIFTHFFYIMRDVLKDGLGAAWTPAFDDAWTNVLARADAAFAEVA